MQKAGWKVIRILDKDADKQENFEHYIISKVDKYN